MQVILSVVMMFAFTAAVIWWATFISRSEQEMARRDILFQVQDELSRMMIQEEICGNIDKVAGLGAASDYLYKRACELGRRHQ